MKFHTMPKDEADLHEKSESCPCKPEVTIEVNADLGVTTTDVKHKTLSTISCDWCGKPVPADGIWVGPDESTLCKSCYDKDQATENH